MHQPVSGGLQLNRNIMLALVNALQDLEGTFSARCKLICEMLRHFQVLGGQQYKLANCVVRRGTSVPLFMRSCALAIANFAELTALVMRDIKVLAAGVALEASGAAGTRGCWP